MKKQFDKIEYKGKDKKEIRNFVINHAINAESYLDLFGDGESYRLAKRKKVNILSIDNGSNFKNKTKLKAKLTGKDKQFISVKNLCTSKTDRKHDVMWLDFCGTLGKSTRESLNVLPNIMTKKGKLFITLLHAREIMLPKGSCRELLDNLTIALIQTILRRQKVETKLFYTKAYISNPKYKGRKIHWGTPMIVYGFKWGKIIT